MNLYIAAFVFLIIEFFTKVFSQGVPISPCPKIFQYRFDGSEWYGLLSVRNPDFGQPLHLRVTLTIRGKPATSYLGEIELLTRGQYFGDFPVLYKVKFPKSHFAPKLLHITTNNQVICFGAPDQNIFVTQIQLEHTRKFTFPAHDAQSSIQPPSSLFYTDTADMDLGGGHTEPEMKDFSMLPTNPAFDTKHLPLATIDKHHLQPLKDICGAIDERIRFQVLVALKQRMPSNTGFENPNDNIDSLLSLQSDDGLEAAERNGGGESELPLIISDSETLLDDEISDDGLASDMKLSSITRGAWPWLAAVYVNNLTSLAYQCGGTLVSSRVVISAAHCFHLFNQRYTANEVLVFLGRHNLKNWNEEGSFASPVDDIYIHPDFNQNLNSYDADIAVVMLKNEVRFNTFIRPACLWSGPTNKEYIEGEHGVVVGWNIGRLKNKKNFSISSTVPKILSAPIVSNEACFQANPMFKSISSNRTFCAGVMLQHRTTAATQNSKQDKQSKTQHRTYQGPCTGDSGAGLMILKNKRWVLRGTVSALLPLQSNKDNPSQTTDSTSNQSCSINQYVIYVDVAEFLDWIYAFLI